MDAAATKHALAALIAEAFGLQGASQSSSDPAAVATLDDDLLFDVQRTVENAASADEGAERLRLLHRNQSRMRAEQPTSQGPRGSEGGDVDAVLKALHDDAVRSALQGSLTSAELQRLDPRFRDARGAALALFERDDPQMAADANRANEMGEDAAVDDSELDAILDADDDAALLAAAVGLTAVGAQHQHQQHLQSRALDMLLSGPDYQGRLLPVMLPSPPRSNSSGGKQQGQQQQHAPLRIRRADGQYLWTCDVCGEENQLADVVHAVRRRNGGVPRSTGAQSWQLTPDEGDGYLLKCRICQCRPSTY